MHLDRKDKPTSWRRGLVSIASKRRAASGIGAVFAAAMLVVVFSAPTYAVHDTGVFQLDGDASSGTQPLSPPAPAATDDWDKVCHQYGANPGICGTSSNTSGSTAGLWTCDTSLTASQSCTINATIFTGGGSKDPQLISSWNWKDGAGGLPAKDNLLHAFAVRYSLTPATTCPSSGTSCEVIYFGLDRFDNSGDAQNGFWFFKGKVGLNADGSFSGAHQLGDVLVVSDFSVGGTTSTITVYTWDPTCTATNKPAGFCADANLHTQATSTNANCANPTPNTGDPFCGIVNPSNGTVVPWSSDYTDKSGNHSYLQGEFYEAGINLSSFGLGGECFSSVAAESRSSTSTTATLKDFVLGNFGKCTPNMTTQASTTGSVVPGQTAVHDTATITVTGASSPADPQGTITFFLCGPSASGNPDCSAGGTNIGTGTMPVNDGTPTDGINSATSPDVNTSGHPLAVGNYCFRAEWPGDSNYAGPVTFTDTSAECFSVAKLNSKTTTSPSSGTITLGNSITDTAVVSGDPVVPTLDPTGTVSFFLCGPLSSGTCTSGGTADTNNPINLTGNGNGTSTATSSAFTPTVVGTYCFRGEYSGDTVYKASSDSTAGECFTVTDTSSAISAQTWYPNDTATVSSGSGHASLKGTLTIQLYTGATCASGGTAVAGQTYTVTATTYQTSITVYSNPADSSTAGVQTSFGVSSPGGDFSWLVTFTSSDANVSGATRCEKSGLTISD